jgi:type IV pilus assembly protein PilV
MCKRLISRKEGFTLLEIMITLVILSISLMALAGLQVSAIKGNDFSKRMTTGLAIAQTKLEQIKRTPYANINSEPLTQVTVSSGSNRNLNFHAQVTVNNNIPLQNTKTVNVTVTWKHNSKSYSIPISTIISQ